MHYIENMAICAFAKCMMTLIKDLKLRKKVDKFSTHFFAETRQSAKFNFKFREKTLQFSVNIQKMNWNITLQLQCHLFSQRNLTSKPPKSLHFCDFSHFFRQNSFNIDIKVTIQESFNAIRRVSSSSFHSLRSSKLIAKTISLGLFQRTFLFNCNTSSKAHFFLFST